MVRKAEVSVNYIFGSVILIVGTIIVMLWSIAEAQGNQALSTLAKWALGLFPILLEIIQAIMRRFR